MTKTMATALASLPPAPVCFAREGRDEQHMNAIPKKERQLDKRAKIPAACADLPPVLRERQSVMALGWGRLADIVVLPPQVAAGRSHRRLDFPSHAGSLLTRKFRVAIVCTIGFRPFDCAFRD
jgi:hypothetical protein